MARQTVFISHPVGSPMDERLIKKVRELFPLCGFKMAKEERGENLLKALHECQTAVFLPFLDGKFCAAQYGEAKFFAQEEKAVWKINPISGRISPLELEEMEFLSVKETLKRLR